MRNAWNEEETRGRRGVPHPRAGDPRRARGGGARRPRSRACSSCCSRGAASTIAYRKRLVDSPSYTLNHEEVEKALEEGIRFAENLTPDARSRSTRFGHARALVVRARSRRRRQRLQREVELPARTVLIAAGTQPNTVLAREDPAHFALDGRYFRAIDEDGKPVTPERSAKPGDVPTC